MDGNGARSLRGKETEFYGNSKEDPYQADAVDQRYASGPQAHYQGAGSRTPELCCHPQRYAGHSRHDQDGAALGDGGRCKVKLPRVQNERHVLLTKTELDVVLPTIIPIC